MTSPEQGPQPRKVALLGSTGSIGCNALEVMAEHPERFQVEALAAGDNVEVMADQVARFHPRLVSMRTAEGRDALRRRLPELRAPMPELEVGPEGLLAVSELGDLLVAATVGVSGLEAIVAALRRGCDVALANKEALVVAGSIVRGSAHASGAALLPIDSEHSAIHQCLRGGGRFERLILTASGGPFLRYSSEAMASITPEAALRHPTWRMGPRITVDSATLMNKGFEVIEACHLFDAEETQVEVMIHPQSIVHSVVQFDDGAMLAQLGAADMKIPIQYALTYPERLPNRRMRIKLEEIGRLEFERPDLQRFPCLRLARAAVRAGGGAPAVLNAADEIAVAAFLAGRLSFARIAVVVEEALAALGSRPASSLENILSLDREARAWAQAWIGSHADL